MKQMFLRTMVAAVLLPLLWTLSACAEQADDDTVTLLALNVGKADALLLRSGESCYLIDTGTSAQWGMISATLRLLDVTHLDGVIVTHMDKDHYGGVKALAMSQIAVDGWYAPWAWEDDDWEKHPVAEAAALRGENVTLLHAGETLPLDGGSITVLGPLSRRKDSENDNSLVLLVEGGGGRMLLTGDMKYDEEEELLKAGEIPTCQVLKVGHHGRDDATSSALVAAVKPQLAIISTSTAELSESPAKKVLNLLKNAGAQIVQTQQAQWGVRVTLRGGVATAEMLNLPELPPLQEGIALREKDNQADTLKIVNTGSETLDLTGCFLRSERGGELLVLPEGLTLAPGEELLVATKSSDVSGDVYWAEKNVWHNKKDDAATLLDVYGRVLATAE